MKQKKMKAKEKTKRSRAASAKTGKHEQGRGFLNALDCGASGSEFEARGCIKDGSNKIKVDQVGDFQEGQWVAVGECCVDFSGTVYNDERPYMVANQSQLKDEVEIKGFNVEKNWQVFVLHFEDTDPVTFNWLAVDPECQPNHRRWQWQVERVPLTDEWIPLRDGVNIRFRKKDWIKGQAVALHVRSSLLTVIEEVKGKTLVLRDSANRDTDRALVRHHDQVALQAALDQAVSEKRNLYLPAGRYRLSRGLVLKGASICIEGEHRDNTILDISEGTGAIFWMVGGRDVVVRRLGLLGHTGFNELPWYKFFTANGHSFWPTANQQMEVKGCAAANIKGTEHLLFEDLRVERMAAEAFYSQGPSRENPRDWDGNKLAGYTRSIIYERCIVTDCASNAFNNNDLAENTSILHCHVENVHNFWEGANRYTRAIGNYVKNAHLGSYGNVFSRVPSLKTLGTGQSVIADNIFEGGAFGHGVSIGIGPSQVIIADNIFTNFGNGSAIRISGCPSGNQYPARYVNVHDNIIDLTAVKDQLDRTRSGIEVSASNVIVANNQVYVREGLCDKATGILLAPHCVNIQVHDNIVSGCKCAIRRGVSRIIYAPATGNYEGDDFFDEIVCEVAKVLEDGDFVASGIPGAWNDDDYLGWDVCWMSGKNSGSSTEIAGYDAEKLVIKTSSPVKVKPGDRFGLHPREPQWIVHHNTFDRCKEIGIPNA